MNLHTEDQFELKLTPNVSCASQCIVESQPLAPALVAMLSNQGQLYYGHLGDDPAKTKLQLTQAPNYQCALYAQSPNRVVASIST